MLTILPKNEQVGENYSREGEKNKINRKTNVLAVVADYRDQFYSIWNELRNKEKMIQ